MPADGLAQLSTVHTWDRRLKFTSKRTDRKL